MTIAPAIARLPFVDLWLAHDYAEYTRDPGVYPELHPLPFEYSEEAARVRDHCSRVFIETANNGFTVELDAETLVRVTVIHDLRGQPNFVLRKIIAEIRQLRSLGLPRLLYDHILDPQTRGLMLICGEQGTGKTTTAAAMVVALLQAHGGRALAIEDPPELRLHGMHGRGRCVQVPVSRLHGSYVDQIHAGMRTGTNVLMLGEIRAPETAREAVQASVNGMTVIANIHGGDCMDGIRRLLTFAQSTGEGMGNAQDLLSAGLSAVIHQRIVRMDGSGASQARAVFQALAISRHDPQQAALRSKIRTGAIDSLKGDIDSQNRRQQWQ